jgi:hypothetical protein
MSAKPHFKTSRGVCTKLNLALAAFIRFSADRATEAANGKRATVKDPSASTRYCMDMRIVVTGERAWVCEELAMVVLRRLIARYDREIVIVHGGAAGVDDCFSKACKSLGIAVEARLANWPQTGTATIGNRNRELIKDGANLCIALRRSIAKSKDTKNCILHALNAGVPTYLIDDEGAIPRRLTVGDPRLE